MTESNESAQNVPSPSKSGDPVAFSGVSHTAHKSWYQSRFWTLAEMLKIGGTVFLAGVVAITASFLVLRPALQGFRELTSEQNTVSQLKLQAELQQQRSLMQEQLDELRTLNEIMVPPSNDKMFAVLAQGQGITEQEITNGTAGTTPTAAFGTDLTTTPYNQRTDAYTQEMTVRNLHATNALCYYGISWSAGGGSTCALKCAASANTCTAGGGAANGVYLPAGSKETHRYNGTNCVCVVASAASTNFQTERLLR